MKTIGYARTTITDDDLQAQLTILSTYGCDEIIQEPFDNKTNEHVSDSLALVISTLNAGDTLVVCCLHHLGKSTRQLTEWTQQLQKNDIHLVSLKEEIDTRHPMGTLYFKLMSDLATMECALIKERTMLGLTKARQNGKIGGRPKIDGRTVKKIRHLYYENKETIQFISTKCGVSVGTCYKYINLPKLEAERLYN